MNVSAVVISTISALIVVLLLIACWLFHVRIQKAIIAKDDRSTRQRFCAYIKIDLKTQQEYLAKIRDTVRSYQKRATTDQTANKLVKLDDMFEDSD